MLSKISELNRARQLIKAHLATNFLLDVFAYSPLGKSLDIAYKLTVAAYSHLYTGGYEEYYSSSNSYVSWTDENGEVQEEQEEIIKISLVNHSRSYWNLGSTLCLLWIAPDNINTSFALAVANLLINYSIDMKQLHTKPVSNHLQVAARALHDALTMLRQPDAQEHNFAPQ